MYGPVDRHILVEGVREYLRCGQQPVIVHGGHRIESRHASFAGPCPNSTIRSQFHTYQVIIRKAGIAGVVRGPCVIVGSQDRESGILGSDDLAVGRIDDDIAERV